jgi:hypothetical protein
MGIFRTILALLVVCTHLRPLDPQVIPVVSGGAVFAVKAFSGNDQPIGAPCDSQTT